MSTSSGLGKTLQRERVSRKLTFDEISGATKISAKFLKAIEEEKFEILPGAIFARNFVRQYATFLCLDPEPLVAMLPRFDLESAPMPQPPNRARPLWNPRWNSAFATAAWTLLAGGAAAAAYVHFSHSPQAVTTVKAAIPQAVQAPAAEAARDEKAAKNENPAPPALSPATFADAGPTHPVQVLVAAREDSWIQATADGKDVFTGMLKAGESRSIAADDRVKVRTGNAGGIDISLKGKQLNSLGPTGQVRSVTLTAEGPLLASPAAPVPQNPPLSEPSPI